VELPEAVVPLGEVAVPAWVVVAVSVDPVVGTADVEPDPDGARVVGASVVGASAVGALLVLVVPEAAVRVAEPEVFCPAACRSAREICAFHSDQEGGHVEKVSTNRPARLPSWALERPGTPRRVAVSPKVKSSNSDSRRVRRRRARGWAPWDERLAARVLFR
jgi:hypothetical protein